MAAQGVRRARLKSHACRRAALAGLVLAASGATRAQDTTFLTTEELATRLRQDLAWIAAQDIGEHGFGLVVGGDAHRLWIVTARHVVVRTPMRGDPSSEQASRSIRVRLCAALPSAEPVNAEPWPAWDAGGEDIAVLTVARPPGYAIAPRALAAGAKAGDDVRLLGSRDECALAPEPGRVRAASEGAHLRIDFAGVQGGSSGAPVLGGSGIVGLMISAEDLTTTVHAIGDLQRRAQSLGGFPWELADARNIPPTDPRAAAVDLPETLNGYQLALRNMHMLLQQQQIPRPRLDEFMKRYNAALGRFLRVRETYDGSLATQWPAPVLPAWRALRDELWSVHQTFWRLNMQMEEIYRSQHGSPELSAQMIALEPELLRLEVEIAQFLRLFAKEP